jgi:hypothetical protein
VQIKDVGSFEVATAVAARDRRRRNELISVVRGRLRKFSSRGTNSNGMRSGCVQT